MSMTAYQRRRFAWLNPGTATCHDYAARDCVNPGARWPAKGQRGYREEARC